MADVSHPLAEFVKAACVSRNAGHASGTLEQAEAIRAAHPDLAATSIHAAAILGEDTFVKRLLREDPCRATSRGGPYDWDVLTHLCFSRYLRLDRKRSDGFVRSAKALLDLGVDIGSVHEEGEPYFDVAKGSSALHVAAWRARHTTVRFLLDRGASVDALDGRGRTALALAVRACVDSYWSDRRSPASVQALLEAGARIQGIPIPCGYREVDDLLEARRASGPTA